MIEEIIALFGEIFELSAGSAKEAFSQNLTPNTVSLSWVSTMCSGTQSHTEMRGFRVLCKTLMRRSWLQVRLHFEIIDWAMLGTPFPKVSSRVVHIVTMELPILIIVHCDGVGNCDFKSLEFSCVCVFF